MKFVLTIATIILLNLIIYGVGRFLGTTYEEAAIPILIGLVSSIMVEVAYD